MSIDSSINATATNRLSEIEKRKFLELLYRKFVKCDLDEVVYFMDEKPRLDRSSHEIDEVIRRLGVLSIDNGLVTLSIGERLYGQEIRKLTIPVFLPRDDNQIWRIFFDAADRKKVHELHRQFSNSRLADNAKDHGYIGGSKPMIKKSNYGEFFIECNKTEMGD
ncbi:MAG: hypothetical protein KA535_05245 [Azonexus sp.]|nr:hypothetical protein [Azonexus sp.]